MIDNILDNLINTENDDTIEIFKDLIQNFNLDTINKYTLETYSSIELEKKFTENQERYSENARPHYTSEIFELTYTILR